MWSAAMQTASSLCTMISAYLNFHTLEKIFIFQQVYKPSDWGREVSVNWHSQAVVLVLVRLDHAATEVDGLQHAPCG